MESCVEDTGGGVVVVGVVVVVVVGVVVVVVVGFSPPLPPHAAVSPPSAIRAVVPATAATRRTLRDLIVFPINTVAFIRTLQETRNLPPGTRLGDLLVGALKTTEPADGAKQQQPV